MPERRILARPPARALEYRVVGGPRGKTCAEAVPVSVLLLDRGNRLYRGEVLRELDRLGFDSIIAVESGAEPLVLEAYAGRYPGLRFLIPSASSLPAGPGELINIGMRESCAPYVFVLWSDMGLSSAGLSGRFFERLAEQERLCMAPLLQAKGGEPIPSASVPVMEGQKLRVLFLPPGRDGSPSLFPFDYSGIYSREKFLHSGGFDTTIENPYWQVLDFGLRSWLWGEEIRLAQALRVAYQEGPPAWDTSPGSDYRKLWLRNLAPEYRGDSAVIPGRRFWTYLKSRHDPFLAYPEFRAQQAWVEANRFRFKMDAASLVDLWEDETP
jgi:hypothetical protein